MCQEARVHVGDLHTLLYFSSVHLFWYFFKIVVLSIQREEKKKITPRPLLLIFSCNRWTAETIAVTSDTTTSYLQMEAAASSVFPCKKSYCFQITRLMRLWENKGQL